jgi:LDH2 family malate/lactate/ureidoglycolate dehydrogenase
MPRVPAEAVARTLVEGDLLGHDTHGLALLAPYIKKLESGSVMRDGLDFLAPIA